VSAASDIKLARTSGVMGVGMDCWADVLPYGRTD